MNVVNIEIAGPDRRVRRLCIQDGEEAIMTSAAVVRALGLQDGALVERAELLANIDEVEPEQAKDRALRLIGYRDRSVGELRQRLIDDGYRPRTVAATIDRMLELRFLDDERFALVWSRSRAATGRGRQVVARELERKGVAGDVATRALSEVFNAEDQVARARAVLRGVVPEGRKERDRCLRKLLRRGFSLEDALRALGPEMEDDRREWL